MHKIYFKRRADGPNGDATWRAYTKEVPCSLESGLDGWTMASSVEVRNTGRTLMVSGGAPQVAKRAVRFAWRAFPCERLGCGVYAQAADGSRLPPPPFYVKL